MSIFVKYNIYIYDIDQLFLKANKAVAQYLINSGLPILFDFSDKDHKNIYMHYFLVTLCDFIVENPHNCKMIFYSNMLTKDPFRNDLIKKIKKIFGFKIWEGIWEHMEFLDILKSKDINIIDQFELYIQSETKPKSFKHIKKYLEKEGFKALNDTYFQDIANKMIVCG